VSSADRVTKHLDDLAEELDQLRLGPRAAPKSSRRLPLTLAQLVERGAIIADNDNVRSAALHAGGSRTIALDDEEMPIVVNDPLGEYVSAKVDGGVPDDVVRKEALYALRRVGHARKALSDARDALIRAVPKPGENGEPGCRVEARWDGGFVAAREDIGDDLCDWCYRFKATYGCDPPEEIARARIAGERISEKFIRQVLDNQRRPRRRRGR